MISNSDMTKRQKSILIVSLEIYRMNFTLKTFYLEQEKYGMQERVRIIY